MRPTPDPHYRHRFLAEIISHAVWPYHVFSLSLRDVELLLAERGVRSRAVRVALHLKAGETGEHAPVEESGEPTSQPRKPVSHLGNRVRKLI